MRGVLLAALAACNPWPEVLPPGGPPLDEPASLGPVVYDGSVYRDTFIAGAYQRDALDLVVFEGAGFTEDGDRREPSVAILSIAADGSTQTLPPLPFASTTPIATTVTGTGLVLAGTGGVASLDGGAWSVVPLPSGVTSDRIRALVARDPGSFALVTRGPPQLFAWTGTTWVEATFAVAPTTLAFAAIDATGLRAVYERGTDIVTTAYAWQTLAPLGADVVIPNAAIFSATPNGTIADFQLVTRDAYYWFHGGAFEPRDASTASTVLLPAPGNARVVSLAMGLDDRSIPAGTFIVGGATGGPAFTGGSGHVPCGCSRETDPSCACLAHDLVVLPVVDPSTTQLAVFSISDLNGHRAIHAARRSLPVTAAFP